MVPTGLPIFASLLPWSLPLTSFIEISRAKDLYSLQGRAGTVNDPNVILKLSVKYIDAGVRSLVVWRPERTPRKELI